MTVNRVAAFAALLSLTTGTASAATATGRITYMAPDRHQLMLDNSDMYALGPKVDRFSVEIGDRVKIDWDRQNDGNMITNMAKAPLTSTAAG